MDRNQTSLKHLSSDLIANEILPRLSVKCILRLTAVCKAWYSLIKSPECINTLFNLNHSESKGQYFLSKDLKTCHILCNGTLTELRTGAPLVLSNKNCSPLQSCCGLILFHLKDKFSFEFVLWNPSIRRFKLIKTSPLLLPHSDIRGIHRHVLYGMGFHALIQDYRLVQITYFIDSRTKGVGHVPTKVDVYSLRTNSWRRVDVDPGRHVGFENGVFLNGAIHWLATSRFKQVSKTPVHDRFETVLLFDIKDEYFKEMALPHNFQYRNNDLVAFKEFEGSIALVVTCCGRRYGYGACHLWVMKEYGVAESWYKQLTVNLNQEINHEIGWPISFTKSGTLFVASGSKYDIFIYDSQNRQTTKISVCRDRLFDFRESLVLLDNGDDLLGYSM